MREYHRFGERLKMVETEDCMLRASDSSLRLIDSLLLEPSISSSLLATIAILPICFSLGYTFLWSSVKAMEGPTSSNLMVAPPTSKAVLTSGNSLLYLHLDTPKTSWEWYTTTPKERFVWTRLNLSVFANDVELSRSLDQSRAL